MKTYNCANCGKENEWTHQKFNKYCDSKCLKESQYKSYIEEWKLGDVDGRKGSSQTSNHIRRYIVEKFNNTCQACKQTGFHNGKPLTLHLEHIDGNSRNNKEENLSLLCPNCHTQTKYYGSRNKGRGRGSLLKNDCGYSPGRGLSLPS
jgi:hypothetical protein